jgi:hypothetical protein
LLTGTKVQILTHEEQDVAPENTTQKLAARANGVPQVLNSQYKRTDTDAESGTKYK